MNEPKKPHLGMILFTVFSAVVCIYPAMLVLPLFAQHRFCLLLLNLLAITLCLLLCRSSRKTWIISVSISVGVYAIALLLDALPIQVDVSVLVFASIYYVFVALFSTLANFIKDCFRQKDNQKAEQPSAF